MSKKTLSLHEKWEKVREHYESAYRDPKTKLSVRFKKIPDPEMILYLYDEMSRLHTSEKKHLDRKRLDEVIY